MNILIKESFVNKADYLLISLNSVRKLRRFLLLSDFNNNNSKNNDELSDAEFLLMQFRPNIVVEILPHGRRKILNDCDDDEHQNFDEEFWSRLKILNKNVEFETVENCTRCQMININQSVGASATENSSSATQKLSKTLLKHVYKLKSNSQFGIYLTLATTPKAKFENGEIGDILGMVSNGEIAVGDIGAAF